MKNKRDEMLCSVRYPSYVRGTYILVYCFVLGVTNKFFFHIINVTCLITLFRYIDDIGVRGDIYICEKNIQEMRVESVCHELGAV